MTTIKIEEPFNDLLKKHLLFALFFLTTFSFISCSHKIASDAFLDEYEKVVVKWEEKAKDSKLTYADLADMNSEILKLTEREKEFKDKSVSELKPEQQERLFKLMARLTEVTTNISNNLK